MALGKLSGKVEWTVALAGSAVFLAAILFFLYNPKSGSMRTEDAVGELAKKARLVEEMRLSLAAASRDEKIALLASDDARSAQYVAQARQDMDALEKTRAELDALILAGGDAQEQTLSRQFGEYWQKSRQISEDLLKLAQINSGVKAFDLSRRKAGPALEAFAADLAAVMDKAEGMANAARIDRLAGQAQVAAYRIMAMHAPHINEEDDAAMDAMEARMVELATSVRSDLAQLESLAGAPALDKAGKDFEAFMAATAEVTRMSRINSNIKALALIFGTGRRAEGLCEDTLTALRVLIINKSYKATR